MTVWKAGLNLRNGLKMSDKNVLEYIEKLKAGSFEGWSEDQENAYLTACVTIEKFIERSK